MKANTPARNHTTVKLGWIESLRTAKFTRYIRNRYRGLLLFCTTETKTCIRYSPIWQSKFYCASSISYLLMRYFEPSKYVVIPATVTQEKAWNHKIIRDLLTESRIWNLPPTQLLDIRSENHFVNSDLVNFRLAMDLSRSHLLTVTRTLVIISRPQWKFLFHSRWPQYPRLNILLREFQIHIFQVSRKIESLFSHTLW